MKCKDTSIVWHPDTPAIDQDLFNEIALTNDPIAIHFWASWNNVDQEFDRTISSVRSRLKGWIDFYSCDIDNPVNLKWIKKIGIASIPSLLVFRKGVKKKHIIGARSEQELVRQLLEGLNDAASGPWWNRLMRFS